MTRPLAGSGRPAGLPDGGGAGSADEPATATRSPRRRLFPEPVTVKVPAAITTSFWVLKLVTTFMGEATSDFLGDHNRALGALVEIGLIGLGIVVQFRTRRFHPVAYWLLAMAIAVFGTGVSDTLHIVVGIPYGGTTALWAAVLVVAFWQWHRREGTLSIHSITSQRRETFYWLTVFVTFALGTALGDFTASVINLGYGPSAILFGALISLPLLAWQAGANPVAMFWTAYVLTRPLGASLADYTSKSHALSGLAVGDGRTAAGSAVVLVLLVAWVALRRPDSAPPDSAPPDGAPPDGAPPDTAAPAGV